MWKLTYRHTYGTWTGDYDTYEKALNAQNYLTLAERATSFIIPDESDHVFVAKLLYNDGQTYCSPRVFNTRKDAENYLASIDQFEIDRTVITEYAPLPF